LGRLFCCSKSSIYVEKGKSNPPIIFFCTQYQSAIQRFGDLSLKHHAPFTPLLLAMNRLQALISHFYKPLLAISLIFTGCALSVILKLGGDTVAIRIALILKLSGYFVCVGYQYFMSPKVYFYYRNAGYSARRMYAYTFTIDFIIFLLLLPLTCLLHNAIANT
jgi:hypothetical protein